MVSCDVSIECAHIYADERLGRSQVRSVALARRESRRWAAEGQTVRSAVLIDDLHAGGSVVASEEVRRWASQLGFGVDMVIEESALVAAAKHVIRSLPRSELYWEPFRRASKRVLFLRHNAEGIALGTIAERCFEPTCALLVAAWHLARLGVFPVDGVLTAKFVTSVLEERYRPVEMKALRIIESSRYRALSTRISHIFY
jgi:hypothetical protein